MINRLTESQRIKSPSQHTSFQQSRLHIFSVFNLQWYVYPTFSLLLCGSFDPAQNYHTIKQEGWLSPTERASAG